MRMSMGYQSDGVWNNLEIEEEDSNRIFSEFIGSEEGKAYCTKEVATNPKITIIKDSVSSLRSVIEIKYPTYVIEVIGNERTGIIDHDEIDDILESVHRLIAIVPTKGYKYYAPLNTYVCWMDSIKENRNLKDIMINLLKERHYILRDYVGTRFREIPITFIDDRKEKFYIDKKNRE